MASSTTCRRHTLTPRTLPHTLFTNTHCALSCNNILRGVNFRFAVSLSLSLFLVSAAANKIHTAAAAAAPILMALSDRPLSWCARKSSRQEGKREREKRGKGKRKKGRKNEELPNPPPRAAAGCDQRESIGHFSPIAVPFETSRACNRAFKCPPSTSTARFVKQ